MPTYFITGAEGVGKTSIVPFLRNHFLTYSVHDFDDVGVPKNPHPNWRLETMQYWIHGALENQNEGKTTILIGLCFPSEFEKCKDNNLIDIPNFCLLDVSKQTRAKRLTKSKRKKLISDIQQWNLLREEFDGLKHVHTVINTSKQNVIQTAQSVIDWIEESL